MFAIDIFVTKLSKFVIGIRIEVQLNCFVFQRHSRFDVTKNKIDFHVIVIRLTFAEKRHYFFDIPNSLPLGWLYFYIPQSSIKG